MAVGRSGVEDGNRQKAAEMARGKRQKRLTGFETVKQTSFPLLNSAGDGGDRGPWGAPDNASVNQQMGLRKGTIGRPITIRSFPIGHLRWRLLRSGGSLSEASCALSDSDAPLLSEPLKAKTSFTFFYAVSDILVAAIALTKINRDDLEPRHVINFPLFPLACGDEPLFFVVVLLAPFRGIVR